MPTCRELSLSVAFVALRTLVVVVVVSGVRWPRRAAKVNILRPAAPSNKVRWRSGALIPRPTLGLLGVPAELVEILPSVTH